MPTPKTMRCIEITKPGSAEMLQLVQRPIPKPGLNEVLIKVSAAGVNRPDVFQRQGLYPPPQGASDILGLEVAGEIVAMGNIEKVRKDQSHWQVGDQVCALLTGGGYAEYAIAHRDLCLPIPKALTPIEAATLPETYFTVWHNIFDSVFGQGAIQQGETLLVHAGTSGIGTTAIQLTTALGYRVITTSSNDEKCKQCLELGADIAINCQSEDFVSRVKEVTHGHGADVILDMVGGGYVQKNIRAAAFRGRIVSIAFLRGSKVDIDLMPVMLKQLILTGSTLRSRPVEEKAHIAKALLENTWHLFSKKGFGNKTLENKSLKSKKHKNKEIIPRIDKTFPLEKASDAHLLMESNQHMGKILLTNN